MISPQTIVTPVSATNLKGQEGVVFARTFWHSIILTLVLGVLVAMQRFIVPWVMPVVEAEGTWLHRRPDLVQKA